jgi:hypothetical protein
MRELGMNIAGTLRFNRNHVPVHIRNCKLQKGELMTQEISGVVIMK